MSADFSPADVTSFEYATWSRCAPGYEDGFAVLTREAVDELLAAAGIRNGHRVLDIGTGTGVVAKAAHDRGSLVQGIDFSERMVEEARRRVPGVKFELGSAESLAFEDQTFDVVVANGVLHHLAEPDRALAEANRVLVPSGRIACTVWAAMESLEAFGLFFAAVEQHAGAAELPHGPLFGVTDEETLSSLFTRAGFRDVKIDTVQTSWKMKSVDTLLRAFGTWAQLDAFPAETRQAIESSVRSAAAAYESDGAVVIPNPMLLIAATKRAGE